MCSDSPFFLKLPPALMRAQSWRGAGSGGAARIRCQVLQLSSEQQNYRHVAQGILVVAMEMQKNCARSFRGSRIAGSVLQAGRYLKHVRRDIMTGWH
jgi:hypothetical protein